MLSESNSPKCTCNSQPLKVRFATHSTILATLLHVSIVRFLFAGSSSTSVAIVWGVTGGQLPAMTFEEFRTRSSSNNNNNSSNNKNNSNTRTTTTRAATTSPRFVYFVWFIVTIFGFCVLFAGVRYIVVVAAVVVAVASVAVAKKAAHTGQSAKSNTPLQFDTSAKRVKGKNDRERERGGKGAAREANCAYAALAKNCKCAIYGQLISSWRFMTASNC